MAPVILALRGESWCELEVCVTAQHRSMLDQVFSLFGISPEYDLDLMQENQTLADLTARAIKALGDLLKKTRPNVVLAQGDTTTVLAAAITCFYERVPFCHVEAGLRTYDFDHPFPEEFNRTVASIVSRLHFAPTTTARENLLREQVPRERILLTGNTVIDALLWTVKQDVPLPVTIPDHHKLILVTVHRRENFGAPLHGICQAVRQIADQNEDLSVLVPVHPNPNVKKVVLDLLGGHPRIHLTHPLEYGEFVASMQRAHLVLTDSGGVQEEAPALGKPVLVMRTTTERPEAIWEGVARLVGVDGAAITREVQTLLDQPGEYARMAKGASPYGDGKAAARIVRAVKAIFQEGSAVYEDGEEFPIGRNLVGG